MSKSQSLPVGRIKTLFENAGIKLDARAAEMIKTVSEDLEAEEGGIDAETARDISDELNDMVDDLASIASDLSEPEQMEDDKGEEGEEEHKPEEEGMEKPEAPEGMSGGGGEESPFEKFGESVSRSRLTEALIKGTYQVPGVNTEADPEVRKQKLSESLINKSYKAPANVNAPVLGVAEKVSE